MSHASGRASLPDAAAPRVHDRAMTRCRRGRCCRGLSRPAVFKKGPAPCLASSAGNTAELFRRTPSASPSKARMAGPSRPSGSRTKRARPSPPRSPATGSLSRSYPGLVRRVFRRRWQPASRPFMREQGRIRANADAATRQSRAGPRGHSTPTLTARYSHRRLHDLAGAVEKLPSFLPDRPSKLSRDRHRRRIRGN